MWTLWHFLKGGFSSIVTLVNMLWNRNHIKRQYNYQQNTKANFPFIWTSENTPSTLPMSYFHPPWRVHLQATKSFLSSLYLVGRHTFVANVSGVIGNLLYFSLLLQVPTSHHIVGNHTSSCNHCNCQAIDCVHALRKAPSALNLGSSASPVPVGR